MLLVMRLDPFEDVLTSKSMPGKKKSANENKGQDFVPKTELVKK